MPARYLTAAAELRRRCARMRKEGQTKLPGELALCAECGCSRETVRRALSILAEEGLIVRVHGSGTYLAGAEPVRRGRVAVVLPSADTYLYPQLLRDLEAVFAEAGCTVELCVTHNLVREERAVLMRLLADPPAGILIEGAKSALPSVNLDLFRQLGQRRVPLVWLHAPLPVPEGAPCIQDENAEGARILVRHLRERGHEHIAAVFKSDDRQGHERYLGFASALLREGLSLEEAHILWYDTAAREALLAGRGDWLERFAARLAPCTAVVCYNDEIAYPLIRALLRIGRRVPEDAAVVSFDNSHLCTLSPVPITSLAHEKHQMGTLAAKALLRLLAGKPAPGARLPWTLRERRSG